MFDYDLISNKVSDDLTSYHVAVIHTESGDQNLLSQDLKFKIERVGIIGVLLRPNTLLNLGSTKLP
jgi:hypothetical protein